LTGNTVNAKGLGQKMKKAASYIRVSTEGQAKDGVSLANQTERIQRYAAYKGNIEIVAEIRDEGISGGINKARPGFIELLNRVQAGDIDVIILYDLDRLSRDMLTLLALEKLLHEYDVEFHTVEGQIDTSTTDGFMAFVMKALTGEIIRRTIKTQTKKAMEHKKGKGEVVGHVGYGYKRDGDSLVPVGSEQTVIALANELHAQGFKLADIARSLNGEGHVTRAGKAWTTTQVRRLIDGYEKRFKWQTTRVGAATRQFIEAIA